MPDIFGPAASVISPLIGAFAITPDDNTDLPNDTRQIRVTGSGGNISCVWQDGQTRTIPVVTGDVLDWRIRRVRSTSTTATGLWGFY